MNRSSCLHLTLGAALLLPAAAINMRHDVPASDYIALGKNAAPFVPGERYPDLSPVCAIGVYEKGGRKKKGKLFEIAGSGTLIAPRFVLTAAHVVVETKRDPGYQAGLVLRFGADSTDPSHEVKVKAVHTRIPEGSPILSTLAERGKITPRLELHADLLDIAILELAEPVDGIAPAEVAAVAPEIGSRLILAGYGDFTTGDQGKPRKWGVAKERRAAENTLDRDHATSPKIPKREKARAEMPEGGLIMIDFDSTDPEHNTLGEEIAGDWEDLLHAGKSGAQPLPLEGSTMPGDSGGPAFVREGDAWKILGICSYGTGFPLSRRNGKPRYGDVGVFNRTVNHAAWIAAIIAGEGES